MKIDVIAPGVREKFEDWIKNRGGVQVWNNLNLSNPDAGHHFTPALTEVKVPEGNGGINFVHLAMIPTPAPHWSVGRGEVITDISRFRFVKSWTEVKRFHVAIRRGSNGLSMKLTDASTRKARVACVKFPGSSYRFDYYTQECVVEVPVWE